MSRDKSEWKTKNPKFFEYDSKNDMVDIFVRADLTCPFPFHKDDWWHQGLYLNSFIIYLNDLFERNNLPYTVMENKEIEDLRMLSQPRQLTEADKKRILDDWNENGNY